MAELPTAGRNDHFSSQLGRLARDLIVVAIVIFLSALAGSLSRPTGFLAMFWPANAVLAGMLIRQPRLRNPAVIAAAAVGYIAAAFIVGDALLAATLMTAANLISALVFAILFSTLDEQDRMLARPRGILLMLLIAIGAGVASAVVGAVPYAQLSGRPYLSAWWGWLLSELVNHVALLPMILTFPPLRKWQQKPDWREARRGALPIGLLLLTLAVSPLLDGPVAIALPFPVLLWCAIALPVPAVAVLVVFYAGFAMMGHKLEAYDLGPSDSDGVGLVHLCVALVAVSPLLVAAAERYRQRQVAALERASRYDSLTDVLTRGALTEQGGALLERLARAHAPVAVLLCDADHFKAINDLHGHAAGDRVLTALATALRVSIRQEDLLGRIGGEEFALVLPDITRRGALRIAERIRSGVENLAIVLAEGEVERVTVSVGVAYATASGNDLGQMISHVDQAMYEAKRAGRNRVHLTDV